MTKNAVAEIVRRSKRGSPDQGSLAVRTMQYIYTIISRRLKDAVELGPVNDNVARNATAPRESKAKLAREFWTAELTRTFPEWARSIDHRL